MLVRLCDLCKKQIIDPQPIPLKVKQEDGDVATIQIQAVVQQIVPERREGHPLDLCPHHKRLLLINILKQMPQEEAVKEVPSPQTVAPPATPPVETELVERSLSEVITEHGSTSSADPAVGVPDERSDTPTPKNS